MKKNLIISLVIGLNMYAQTFTGLAPLKVGNSWTYVDDYFGNDPKYEKYTVLDSGVVIGSNVFYKIEYRNSNFTDNVYMGKNDDFYYRYSKEFVDSLYLYLKQPIILRDTWKQYFNPPDSVELTTIVNDSFITSTFGKNTMVYELIRETILIGSGEYWTNEFGRLYSIEEFAEYTLVGCVIDGVEYGDTTLVSVDYDESLPNEITLSQNYPNPFNPTTIIKYYLPVYSNVRLVIYNSLGQTVETLVSEFQTSGEYKVQFNAIGYSTGVYFYCLITDNNKMTRKMLIIK